MGSFRYYYVCEISFLGRNKKGERKLAKLSGRKRGEATKDPPFADGSAILRRVPPFE